MSRDLLEIPVRMIEAVGIGVTNLNPYFDNAGQQRMYVVTDIGAVIAGTAGSGPCHAVFSVGAGVSFFYDSQSVGEGDGIRFIWQGFRVIPPTGRLQIALDSPIAENMSVCADGYWIPMVPTG